MNDTIRIVFKGQLLPGKSQEEVAPRLAAALKIPLQQAHTLFSGQTVTLKRNLPRADFARYAENLSRIGIVVEMEDEASTPTPPAPPAPTTPDEDENLLFPSLFGAAPATPPAPSPANTPINTATAAPTTVMLTSEPELMKCPKCGAQQPKRTLCRECGVDMPRFAAAQTQAASEPVAPTQPNGLPVHASQIAPDIDQEDGAEDTPPFRSISFEGRLNRVRSMAYALGAVLIFCLVLGLMIPLGLIRNEVGIGFFGLLFIGYMLRLTTLRLHDMDRSGWWQLLTLGIGVIQSIGTYRMLATGSSLLFNLSGVLTFIYMLWLIGWPGSLKGNRFGYPNERNTALGYIGAAFFVLALIASAIGAKDERLQKFRQPKKAEESQRAFITLYCNSSAAACHDARNWFSSHPRFHYEDCNIESTPACRSEFDRMGGTVVPMLVVGDKKHDGFDPEWMQKEVMAEMMRRAQEHQQQHGDDNED